MKMKGQIKEVKKSEDFEEVYKVFSGPPYNEKYTKEDIQEIFQEYQEKGYVYGAYSGEKCIGIVALEKGAKKEHPVKFEEEKTIYLADVAVLNSYRKTGLGTQLMAFAVMQSKELGFQKIYMRTLEVEKSMSYGIARKIGFQQIPNVYQSVKRERIDGSVTAVQNIFLELDLNCLDKNLLKRNIQNSCTKMKERKGEEKC